MMPPKAQGSTAPCESAGTPLIVTWGASADQGPVGCGIHGLLGRGLGLPGAEQPPKGGMLAKGKASLTVAR